MDDWFADIGRRSPSFAGLYMQGDGVVLLTSNVADGPSNLQAIRDVDGGRLFNGFARADQGGAISVRPVRFAFLSLYGWYQTLLRTLPRGSVRFTDIDEVGNRIHIGARDSSWVSRIQDLAIGLGVPAEALMVDATVLVLPALSLNDRFRPIPGGVQVEYFDGLCSVGVAATSDLGEGFITASHCSSDFGDGADYTAYYQDTDGENNFVGYEYDDPALTPAGYQSCPSPPATVGCRISDANYVLAPELVQVGAIARTTGIGSKTIDNDHPRFLISDEFLEFLMAGDSVQRIGENTGWRHGAVTYTCVDIEDWVEVGLVLQCQWFSSAVADEGDSGGPLFLWDGYGSYVQIAGLTIGLTRDPNTHQINGSVFSPWVYVTFDVGGDVGNLSVTY